MRLLKEDEDIIGFIPERTRNDGTTNCTTDPQTQRNLTEPMGPDCETVPVLLKQLFLSAARAASRTKPPAVSITSGFQMSAEHSCRFLNQPDNLIHTSSTVGTTLGH